jgi:hypothetical protein
MMELKLKNIGGLEGEHRFELMKGVNEIVAPNAEGKSSIVRSLELLVCDDDLLLKQALHLGANDGFVELGGWNRYLKRENESVYIEKEDPLSQGYKNPHLIAFFTPGSYVITGLQSGMLDIGEYIERISDVGELRSRLEDAEREVQIAVNEVNGRMGELDRLLKLRTKEDVKNNEIREAEEEKSDVDEKIKEKISDEREKTLFNEKNRKSVKLDENRGKIRKSNNEISKINVFIDKKNREIGELQAGIRGKCEEKEKKKSFIKKIDELKKDKEKLEAERKKIQDGVRKLEIIESKKKAYYDLIGDALDKLIWRELTECPVCGGDVTSTQINERRNKLKDEIIEISKKLVEKRKGRDLKQEDIGRIEAKMKTDKGDVAFLAEEIKEMEETVGKLEEEIKKKNSKKERAMSEIERLKIENIDLEEGIKKLDDELASIPHDLRHYQGELTDRISHLKEEFDIIRSNKERIAAEIEFSDDEREYSVKLEREIVKPKEEEEKKTRERYKDEMSKAINIFNEEIKEVYEKLGFKEFEDVKIEVVDEKEGGMRLTIINRDGLEQPVDTLSVSERMTLALTLQLSALEAYIPDFPLFVIDETIDGYDRNRASSVRSYLSGKVDYALITSPVEEEGLKIRPI